MKNITLYTDGACSGNPGAGGWACVLLYGENKKFLSGGEKLTTNNRMELTAVIQGLKALKEPCNVSVYSDSAYIINSFNNGWIDNWLKNGWKTVDKKEVLNKDLWQELLNLSDIHKITWNKVKGHASDELNNKCDELARGEVEKILKSN